MAYVIEVRAKETIGLPTEDGEHTLPLTKDETYTIHPYRDRPYCTVFRGVWWSNVSLEHFDMDNIVRVIAKE